MSALPQPAPSPLAPPQAEFFGEVIDCLPHQLCVIDSAARIVFVNRAWRQFGQDGGLDYGWNWLGADYLNACLPAAANGDPDALIVQRSLELLLSGQRERFQHEYPCHAPQEQRWFLLQGAALPAWPGYFVLVHQDVSPSKRMEMQAVATQRELMRLVTLDSLTDLANRRRLDAVLLESVRRAQRYGNPLAVALIDLDHFKHINDSHGHRAGDQVLRRVGELLRQSTRAVDLAGRWGGEEFLVVLPECDLAAARGVAAKLCKLVSELDLQPLPQLTCSIGVAAFRDGDEPQSLLDRADQALYRAKAAGRNCVECG